MIKEKKSMICKMSAKSILSTFLIACIVIIVVSLCLPERAMTTLSVASNVFSNIIIPILTVTNVLVLLNVSQSVEQLDKKSIEHNKKIEEQNISGAAPEFQMQLDPTTSFDEAYREVESSFKVLMKAVNNIEECLKPNECWEMVNIGIPNQCSHIELYLHQMKVKAYEYRYAAEKTKENERQLRAAEVELEQLHKGLSYID